MDTKAKAKTLLEECKSGKLKLETLIVMESLSDEVKSLAEETNINVKTFAEVDEIGKNNLKDFVVRWDVWLYDKLY